MIEANSLAVSFAETARFARDNQRTENLGTFLEILDGDLIGKTVTLQILRGSDFALAEKRVKVVKLELDEI